MPDSVEPEPEEVNSGEPGSVAVDTAPTSSAAAHSVAPDSDFELGRSALLEITSAESIGAPAGSIDEGDGVTTLYFETLLSGYPGWRWTVSIAHLDDTPASVLETELTPGDEALLSPAWVPWVDRLADYTAAQDTAVEDDETNDELDDEDSDDDDDDDESDETDDDESDDEDEDDDDDDLGSDVLHGGDLDGVDIDDLDESENDDSGDDDSDDDDSGDDDDGLDDGDDDPEDEDEDEHERSV